MDRLYDDPGICSREHNYIFHSNSDLCFAACALHLGSCRCRTDLFSDAYPQKSGFVNIVLQYLLEHIVCCRNLFLFFLRFQLLERIPWQDS